jgi:hypothetical protein
MQLELLKLQYEIEVLKKDHQLEPIKVNESIGRRSMDAPVNDRSHDVVLPRKLRFLYGFIGGISPAAIRLTQNIVSNNYLSPGFIVGICITGLLGGATALLLTKPTTTAKTCFFVGASIIFIVQGAFSTVSAPPSPPVSTLPPRP